MSRHPHFKSILQKLVKEELSRLMTKVLQPGGMKHNLDNHIKKLTEAKIDDIKKRYPTISAKLDMFREVPPKYLEWIAKHLENKSLPEGEEATLLDVIKRFDALVQQGGNKIQNKDINAYKTFGELERTVIDADSKKSNTELKKSAKSNVTQVFKNDRYTIIQPLSMEASCYYGFGTKWCISARESENYYERYAENGVKFYFVMDNQATDSAYAKVAVAVYPGGGSLSSNTLEIYDAGDNLVPKQKFMQLYPKEVLSALNLVSKNQFKSVKEIVDEMKLDQVSDQDFIKKMNILDMKFQRELETTDDQEQDLDHPQEPSDLAATLAEVINRVPLDRLALMYHLNGHLTSPSIVEKIVERMSRDVNDLDTLFAMATKSYSLYGYNINHVAYDMYTKYLEKNMNKFLGKENLVKLWQFQVGKFHPFQYEVLDVLRDIKGMELGELKNRHALNIWYRNSNFRQTIQKLATETNPEVINKLWHEIDNYFSIDPRDAVIALNLFKQGKLSMNPDQEINSAPTEEQLRNIPF